MFIQFKRLLIGRPKRNRDLKNEKISKFKGLAILSSDALSSVAYGPEQILITLSVYAAYCRSSFNIINSSNFIL